MGVVLSLRDMLESWYRYRAEAIEQIARDWLEEHKLAYK